MAGAGWRDEGNGHRILGSASDPEPIQAWLAQPGSSFRGWLGSPGSTDPRWPSQPWIRAPPTCPLPPNGPNLAWFKPQTWAMQPTSHSSTPVPHRSQNHAKKTPEFQN